MKKLLLLAGIFLSLSLNSQTSRTWTGSSSTDWNTAGNWSPSGVPSTADHIVLNTASGNQPVLDANRNITNITVSAGTIDVNGYTLTVTGSTNLTGGNIINGVLTFNNTTTNISGMTIGATVNITATGATITNSTFNKKLFVTQTSGAGSYTWTGNTYNDTLDYRYTGSATSAGISFLNSTANGDVYISTANTYTLIFGSGATSTNKFTLAANKRIKIGSSGWSSGANINLYNVEFNDANPFTLNYSGGLNIGNSAFATSYGPAFNITAASATITNATFNKKLLVSQSYTGPVTWTGNTFNDTLDYRYTGAGSGHNISFLNSTANEDVYISTANTYNLVFGSGATSTNKFTLAANKRIKIGSSGWSSGANINLYNVEFNDANPFTLNYSGGLNIGNSAFATSYGPAFNITAASATITNATFNKKLLVSQSYTGPVTWTGNTFNDTLDYRYTGGTSGSSISFLNSTANEDVYISTANTYTLIFGSYATSTNKFTLASNKRIKIGPSGWSGSGSIQLYNVEINGSSPFTLSINSSSSVNIGNPNFAIAYSNPFDITSGYFNLSKGTFNDKFTVTKTGTGVNNIYGGNTFNDTLDIRLGAGNITMHLNANDAYNEDIYVSNTGTGVLYFGNGGNGCTLASGKRILIGSSGFNSGTLSLQKFTQTSTTAQSITLGGTTTSFFIGNSSTFNGTLTIQAPNIDIGNSTFNKKVTLTKTGSVTNYSYGGNTYNDTLDIRLQAGSLFINYYGNDVANGDLYVSNTGSGSITLGSSPTFTLATGKKIYIGSAGFASGTLAFGRFIQSGTTDQSITLTSSAAISFGACTFNGRVTATTPSVFISGATFNKKFTLIKNGATNLELTGGNTFNDTVDYQLQNGNILFATSYNDTYNGDLIVSNTGSGTMTFGFHGSSTLASGKKIEIGSAGFANGGLTLNRFVQNGTADQIITLTGTAGLVIGGASTFNGRTFLTAQGITIGGGTFNKKCSITKTGTSYQQWGGNTFNDTTEFNIQGAGIILTATSSPDVYNGDIILNSTAAGTLTFGYFANSTLASGKRIYVGSGGFSAGTISLTRFTQTGSTAQNITFTGGIFSISTNSVFNGDLTISGPSIGLSSSTFNGVVTVTKTGSTENQWGGNTFNSNVDVTNNSTGNLYASYAASGSDNYNANATFTKSSSGGMFLAGYNATVYFKGDVTLNNISTAQQSGSSVVVFTGTAGQTLTQSSGLMGFNRITVNKASNNLTLGAPLTIGTALTLTSGKIISTSTNLLTFADNATVSGASNSSYVEGPVAKTGNDIFTFPIGKSGTYRPLGISAPASTATIFTADYIPSVQTAGSSADTSVTNLSTCEHWLLSRSGSSSNVNVTLSWNSTTCNRASALNMRVSGWSGSSWTNHGNGARTGNSTAGTVTSSTNPSAYNVFALSNKTCTATAAITPSGATTFCAGNAVTLTATAGAINYLWSTTAITQAINATTSATYTINLTDTSGCNGIANQVVTVHANPVANAGTDTTFCSFNTVNLGGSPSASSGTPGYSYTWSPADYLDNAFGANPNFNGIIGSQYVLEVSDANGCLDKDTVQVTVNPGVLLNGGGSKTVCAGSGVVIGNDIAILSGIGPYTYSWSPNTNLDDDTIATPLSTPVTSTTYTVEITDANGCQTTKDVNVTVAPLVNAPRKKITAQRNIVID